MKLVWSTFFLLILTTSTVIVNGANIDVDFSSVIKKLKSIDLATIDAKTIDLYPTTLLGTLDYFDFDCVVGKLGVKNVDQQQIYDIKNMTQFESLNVKNKKILIAVEKAARVCTRTSISHKNEGIFDIIQLRGFMAKLIFPDVRLRPERARECFEWVLSSIEPNSPLVKEFNVSSLNYSTSVCKEQTSTNEYQNQIKKEMKMLNIRACNVETFAQAAALGHNIMKIFLFSQSFEKIPQYQQQLSNEAIEFEGNLLEAQLDCLLRDLRGK